MYEIPETIHRGTVSKNMGINKISPKKAIKNKNKNNATKNSI